MRESGALPRREEVWQERLTEGVERGTKMPFRGYDRALPPLEAVGIAGVRANLTNLSFLLRVNYNQEMCKIARFRWGQTGAA